MLYYQNIHGFFNITMECIDITKYIPVQGNATLIGNSVPLTYCVIPWFRT